MTNTHITHLYFYRNKHDMWKVIEELKKNALVILTTHSMPEAEALSDKICILALGR